MRPTARGPTGENAVAIRKRACRDAAWLGVELDRAANAAGGPRVTTDRSRTAAWVVDAVHRLAYRRKNHANLHVRGYKEKGSINTPLGLAIENQVDRFSLAMDVIDRVPRLRSAGAHAKERFRNRQIECRLHAHEHGIDPPEIIGWRWPAAAALTPLPAWRMARFDRDVPVVPRGEHPNKPARLVARRGDTPAVRAGDQVLLVPGFFGFGSFGREGRPHIVYFDHVIKAMVAARPELNGRIHVHEPPPMGSLQARVRTLQDAVLQRLGGALLRGETKGRGVRASTSSATRPAASTRGCSRTPATASMERTASCGRSSCGTSARW